MTYADKNKKCGTQFQVDYTNLNFFQNQLIIRLMY